MKHVLLEFKSSGMNIEERGWFFGITDNEMAVPITVTDTKVPDYACVHAEGMKTFIKGFVVEPCTIHVMIRTACPIDMYQAALDLSDMDECSLQDTIRSAVHKYIEEA